MPALLPAALFFCLATAIAPCTPITARRGNSFSLLDMARGSADPEAIWGFSMPPDPQPGETRMRVIRILKNEKWTVQKDVATAQQVPVFSPTSAANHPSHHLAPQRTETGENLAGVRGLIDRDVQEIPSAMGALRLQVRRGGKRRV